MDLREYFENTHGFGVLATADATGKVNAAVYARPHMTESGEAVFIMADRRCYKNVSENPSAVYLFHERDVCDDGFYKGVRLSLTKIHEDDDPVVIEALRRRTSSNSGENRHMVYFKVDEVRPLVGDSALHGD